MIYMLGPDTPLTTPIAVPLCGPLRDIAALSWLQKRAVWLQFPNPWLQRRGSVVSEGDHSLDAVRTRPPRSRGTRRRPGGRAPAGDSPGRGARRGRRARVDRPARR